MPAAAPTETEVENDLIDFTAIEGFSTDRAVEANLAFEKRRHCETHSHPFPVKLLWRIRRNCKRTATHYLIEDCDTCGQFSMYVCTPCLKGFEGPAEQLGLEWVCTTCNNPGLRLSAIPL